MPMIHGSFRSFAVASGALSALSAAGIPFQHASFVSSEAPLPETDRKPPSISAEGMGTGGMIAAIATGVVAAGMAATGVGLFVAGPIAAALAGVGAGGMTGSFVATLAGAGVAKDDAIAAQEALQHGRVVTIVEVEDDQVVNTRNVFAAHAAANAEQSGGVSAPQPGAEEEIGEGNRAAARRYDEGVEKTIASGKVDELAHEAKAAVDDPVQGPALKQAEARAKRGPMSPSASRSR